MKAALLLPAMVAVAVAYAGLARADAPPSRASQAYERAQSMRADARRKVENAHGSREALESAAKELEDALDGLDAPQVRELAVGNVPLFYRRFDVLREYAGVLALLGRKEEALDALERMAQVGWSPAAAKWVAEDDNLASLRDEPRFKAVLAALATPDRVWKTPAFDTGFREALSPEERIAGLTLFWSEARSGFAYFDHVPDLDWSRAYLDFLPRVAAASTTEDYYRVLMQFAALLHDGHTSVYAPRELHDRFYAFPPIRTEKLGDKVVITGVYSAALRERLHAGDEIVALDGIPVERYAHDSVAPYVSASTPQDRDVRTFGYQLLDGDASRPLKITVRGAAGAEHTETVTRGGYDDVTYPAPFEFRMLPGDIAYLSLFHFQGDAAVKAFEAALPRIVGAKGLVLDVRRNGGGSSVIGWRILSYLTDRPIPIAHSRTRAETSLDRAHGARITWRDVSSPNASITLEHDRHFDGPVAVLIGPRTFSAAEDFVMSFDAMKRGILVGSPTAGSTGQPIEFALPGGGTARICVKRDTYPDGRPFVGRGIAPQIQASATIDDVRAGRDPVLDRAMAELSKAR